MFFVMLLIGFVGVGCFLMLADVFIPGFFVPIVAVSIRYLGMILIWTGILVYLGRNFSTGANLLVDLPDPRRTLLLHIGNSSAKLVKSIKGELNSLIVRGRNRMRVKDMGDSINVAGHDLQISCQTVGFTLPLWLLDLIDRWKKRYGVRNKEEFLKVYNTLRSIRDDDPSFVIEEKLGSIDVLKPVLSDSVKRKELLSLSPGQLRNMSELLFDGRTVNVKSYLDWDESANPYDNESIISRTLAHRAEQRSSYRFAGGVDWGKIAVPLAVILIAGAIAYQIFGG